MWWIQVDTIWSGKKGMPWQQYSHEVDGIDVRDFDSVLRVEKGRPWIDGYGWMFRHDPVEAEAFGSTVQAAFFHVDNLVISSLTASPCLVSSQGIEKKSLSMQFHSTHCYTMALNIWVMWSSKELWSLTRLQGNNAVILRDPRLWEDPTKLICERHNETRREEGLMLPFVAQRWHSHKGAGVGTQGNDLDSVMGEGQWGASEHDWRGPGSPYLSSGHWSLLASQGRSWRNLCAIVTLPKMLCQICHVSFW